MALIRCGVCGHNVGASNPHCQDCGAELVQKKPGPVCSVRFASERTSPEASFSSRAEWVFLAGCCVCIGLLLLFYASAGRGFIC